MIRNATLTILGLWQYDNTILNGLQVPQGISLATVRDNLLMECAELEAVYPDPDFMKQAVTSWSAMMAPIWQELYDTTQYDYNPIWNKDGTITETVTRGLETEDSGRVTSNNEEQHQTKGYNSTTWADSTKDTGTASSTTSATGSEDETTSLSRRETGNIGVTTTQQMIREQREVVELNMVKRIIDDFKMRFCILVY